jgi:hypothetical protein
LGFIGLAGFGDEFEYAERSEWSGRGGITVRGRSFLRTLGNHVGQNAAGFSTGFVFRRPTKEGMVQKGMTR